MQVKSSVERIIGGQDCRIIGGSPPTILLSYYPIILKNEKEKQNENEWAASPTILLSYNPKE
jgi:hypothetical protein